MKIHRIPLYCCKSDPYRKIYARANWRSVVVNDLELFYKYFTPQLNNNQKSDIAATFSENSLLGYVHNNPSFQLPKSTHKKSINLQNKIVDFQNCRSYTKG